MTEADLQDYPGIYLAGSSVNPDRLTVIFSYYPFKEEMTRDRDIIFIETADSIEKTYDLPCDG